MEPRIVHDIAVVLFSEENEDRVSADIADGPVDVTEYTRAVVDATVGHFRSHSKSPRPGDIPFLTKPL